MIERWLQVTCDGCGETDNSTFPNQTIDEFLAGLRPHFVKVGRQHFCRRCRDGKPKRGRS